MALTLVAGVRARDSLVTAREDTDYARGIALLEPWKNPMTLVTQRLGHYSSDTVDFHHYEDVTVPYQDQVNNGGGYSDTDTAIVVDTGGLFKAGDLVRVDETGEIMLVTSVSTNTLTVIRDYGQAEGWTASAAALVDNYHLTRLSNAFEQGHDLPDSVTTQEVDVKNYTQDIRTSWLLTDILQNSLLRGEQDQAFQDRKKGIEHFMKIEMANIIGKPYAGDKGAFSGSHGSGDAPTTCGGCNYFIENEGDTNLMVDQTDLTMWEFVDFLEPLFQYGSATRFCFCPSALRTALDKWGITKMQTFASQDVLGMKIGRWDSSHGTVYFIMHDALRPAASTLWKNCFFLDMDKLDWVTLQNIGSTSMTTVDYRHSTGATKTGYEYRTIQGIRFRQPKCHGRLRLKTVSVA